MAWIREANVSSEAACVRDINQDCEYLKYLTQKTNLFKKHHGLQMPSVLHHVSEQSSSMCAGLSTPENSMFLVLHSMCDQKQTGMALTWLKCLCQQCRAGEVRVGIKILPKTDSGPCLYIGGTSLEYLTRASMLCPYPAKFCARMCLSGGPSTCPASCLDPFLLLPLISD